MDPNPIQIVDEIHKSMMHLAFVDYDHRTLAEFLELLEKGEDWVKEMRDFLGAAK